MNLLHLRLKIVKAKQDLNILKVSEIDQWFETKYNAAVSTVKNWSNFSKKNSRDCLRGVNTKKYL